MKPEELEKITQKEILKARIRNLQRWSGGKNTVSIRIKLLKEELKKLEGEDGIQKR